MSKRKSPPPLQPEKPAFDMFEFLKLRAMGCDFMSADCPQSDDFWVLPLNEYAINWLRIFDAENRSAPFLVRNEEWHGAFPDACGLEIASTAFELTEQREQHRLSELYHKVGPKRFQEMMDAEKEANP